MICCIWGEDKSCKNTLALTFPKPLVDMEFDVGGFRRSCRNLPDIPIKDWYDQGLITVEPYIMPMQFRLEDLVAARPTKIIVGMKELFYKFAAAFLHHLDNPDIATIVVDTGTLLYDVICSGYMQELQERQLPLKPDGMGKDGKTLRTQLQPIEYKDPNIKMRGFAYQAAACNKHLVITHHASDEYGPVKLKDGSLGDGKTGKRIMHGWSQWGDSADIVGHTYWDKTQKKSFFKIELSEVQEMRDMVIEDPTFDKIDGVIKMIRGE